MTPSIAGLIAPHQRRHTKITDLLTTSTVLLNQAAGASSPQQASHLIRQAESRARHAAAQLATLAFHIEH